ncbi:MAG TPA: OmpH family outer membrane protein [Syntrophorhabdaceae bacterium]|nr:OmpH family outer membrane protein [Syntrophorhabdaceae bacterium]HQM81017.1 OmpH family outer membrane protein [Syntrophorhabdaceae bacterium]
MKRLFVLGVSVFFIICFLGIQDVSAQAVKVGVFEVQKVMRESKTFEGYRQDLMREIEAKRKPLRDREESARATEQKLRQEGDKLPVNERRALEERLANDARDIRRLREDFEVEVRKLDTQLAQKALGVISGVIKNIGEKEGYTLIFERSAAGIAYFKDTIDITGKIIQQIK